MFSARDPAPQGTAPRRAGANAMWVRSPGHFKKMLGASWKVFNSPPSRPLFAQKKEPALGKGDPCHRRVVLPRVDVGHKNSGRAGRGASDPCRLGTVWPILRRPQPTRPLGRPRRRSTASCTSTPCCLPRPSAATSRLSAPLWGARSRAAPRPLPGAESSPRPPQNPAILVLRTAGLLLGFPHSALSKHSTRTDGHMPCHGSPGIGYAGL